MEGDLSLSQALGGLRIANQTDDSPPVSPRQPPTSSSSNDPSTIHIPNLQSFNSQKTFATSDTNYASSLNDNTHSGASSQSLPLSQHQQRSTFPPPTSSSSSRPSSQYMQSYPPNAPTTYPPSGASNVTASSVNSGIYPDYTRMSREPSRSSLSGPSLSSRPSQRERSNTDRSYRQSQPSVKKGVKDFVFGRTLGEGSYSTVLAATDRTTLKEYAIKVLDKRHIIKEKKVKYVNIEKNTLNRLGEHPGVVRLYYTFQDERSLYFVLDLATGGELLGFLKRMTTFDEECTKYYSAQILDTIEYMHSRGVIHRDLKPENVLLDDQMRVKITDFGTAKILDPPKKPLPQNGANGDGCVSPYSGDQMEGADDSRANSFVGTAEYVSPELLTDKAACKASDLWAFGCIVFQLLSGRPPFKASNEYQTFQKIVQLEYEFPKGFPPIARDLVERLLVLDPVKRLNIEHIKNHQFFDGVEWGRKLWKQKAPRLKPYVAPAAEEKVIKLNGYGSSNSVGPPRNGGAQNGVNMSNPRPLPPRVITELPPPSQLDIEWSPVLTRSNERILKLGNATVHSSAAPHSPDGKGGINGHTETPKKNFARFFTGGNTSKKRQRLVMITTCARVIIAAAGGDDKKMKTEINLQGLGIVVRKVGSTNSNTWAIDTRDKCYTFEDSKTPASEWLETIDRAREIATVNYPTEDGGFMSSTLSSPASTITLEAANGHSYQDRGGRGGDSGNVKRFSKRNSRQGLAAVF